MHLHSKSASLTHATRFPTQVVNALLTQLDKLKHRKNVLVMSTSNIAQAIGKIPPSPLESVVRVPPTPMLTPPRTKPIDSAFVDRADIKQYIGLPPPEANHWILSGCLNEMMKRGLMEPIVSMCAG